MKKLDCYILPQRIGTTYGSGCLKSLQNKNIPELDLLVREAIQNSLDASLAETETICHISFKTGKFISNDFIELLDKITIPMRELYKEKSYTFMEIRDTGTCGLTGPIRYSDVKQNNLGNFLKLVFEMGKSHTETYTGGSWGYGKSVYYRLGVGFVLFYSRVRVNNTEFENRLIISFMEDETKKHAVIKEIEEDSVGRAWWGKGVKESIEPIIDDKQIEEILNIFGVKIFGENETGTSIIIPYINIGNRLLKDILPEDNDFDDEEQTISETLGSFRKKYITSLDKYLKLAVQKWYSPRLNNAKLKKELRVSINDELLSDSEIHPYFQIIRTLYTQAYNGEVSVNKIENNVLYSCEKITSRKTEENVAGYVSCASFRKDELNSISAGWPIPHIYFGLYDEQADRSVVMYARDHGMILNYKTDGMWGGKLNRVTQEDEIRFVFFVPVSNARLKEEKLKNSGINTLGEYLRQCEKSDHMNWEDFSSFTIIKQITRSVTNHYNDKISRTNDFSTDEKIEDNNLSKMLGRLLLSTSGQSGRSTGKKGITGGKRKKSEIEITNIKRQNNTIILDSVITIPAACTAADIEVEIISESGFIGYNTWKETFSEDSPDKFPIQIASVENIICFRNNSKDKFQMQSLNDCCCVSECEFGTVLNHHYGLTVNKNETVKDDITIKGTIVLKSSDKKYKCHLKVNERVAHE